MDAPPGPAAGNARVRIHPGLLFMLLLGAAGLAQYGRSLPMRWKFLEDHAIAAYGAAFAAGMGLGLWAFITLRRAGTGVDPKEPTTRLVARGPYRFTRNPLYLAQLLVMLGFAALTRSWWFLGAVPILAILLNYLVILPEERYLAGLLGDEYAAYCRKVRRWV